jgi:hypothetical protein
MYGAMTAFAFVDESRRYPEMKPLRVRMPWP